MAKEDNVRDFFEDLANAIRIKSNSEDKYTPEGMREVIQTIDPDNYGCLIDEMVDKTGDGSNKIKRIIIKEGTKTINYAAFQNFKNLEFVYLPDSVTSIGAVAFSGTNLTIINIPENLASVSSDSFGNTPWVNSLDDGVVYLGKCLFKLKNYTMPSDGIFIVKDGTLGITSNVFQNRTDLTSIQIPEGVKVIGINAFSGSGLTEIEIPSTVTELNSEILSKCSSLVKVKVKKVFNIYKSAFANCPKVHTYDFSECTLVPTLNASDVFSGISDSCEILVPESLYDKWIAAPYWKYYADHIKAI